MSGGWGFLSLLHSLNFSCFYGSSSSSPPSSYFICDNYFILLLFSSSFNKVLFFSRKHIFWLLQLDSTKCYFIYLFIYLTALHSGSWKSSAAVECEQRCQF